MAPPVFADQPDRVDDSNAVFERLGVVRRAFAEAEAKLYEWYSPEVWQVFLGAYRIDLANAADLLTDVFTKIVRSLPEFRGQSRKELSDWVWQIVCDRLGKWVRRKKVAFPYHKRGQLDFRVFEER